MDMSVLIREYLVEREASRSLTARDDVLVLLLLDGRPSRFRIRACKFAT